MLTIIPIFIKIFSKQYWKFTEVIEVNPEPPVYSEGNYAVMRRTNVLIWNEYVLFMLSLFMLLISQ